jgi:general secretion pathway protein C
MRLRNGDVITGVNGRSIESVEDAVAAFEDLTTSSEIQIDIKRRGRKRRFDYRIR